MVRHPAGTLARTFAHPAARERADRFVERKEPSPTAGCPRPRWATCEKLIQVLRRLTSLEGL
jgi:hypothetical protein